MRTLITIGTSDGVWAPPKPVDLCVTMDGKTGLAITNANRVMWDTEGSGLITAAAIQIGTRQWVRIDLTGGTPVRKGQGVGLEARALMLDMSLPIISAPNMAQHQLRSRRGLGRYFAQKHLPSGE